MVPAKWLRMDLAKLEALSPRPIGADIGMVIGRSIEAQTEMGLEIHRLRPV